MLWPRMNDLITAQQTAAEVLHMEDKSHVESSVEEKNEVEKIVKKQQR